jgi:hypothetical protein
MEHPGGFDLMSIQTENRRAETTTRYFLLDHGRSGHETFCTPGDGAAHHAATDYVRPHDPIS